MVLQKDRLERDRGVLALGSTLPHRHPPSPQAGSADGWALIVKHRFDLSDEKVVQGLHEN